MGNSARYRLASSSVMARVAISLIVLPPADSSRLSIATGVKWSMGDVLAVVTDLFFQARITAAARAAGRKVHYVVTEPQLQDAGQYAVALVDLDARTDVLAMIRRLKSDGLAPIVAFGPHLDTERRKQARSAGADRV